MRTRALPAPAKAGGLGTGNFKRGYSRESQAPDAAAAAAAAPRTRLIPEPTNKAWADTAEECKAREQLRLKLEEEIAKCDEDIAAAGRRKALAQLAQLQASSRSPSDSDMIPSLRLRRARARLRLKVSPRLKTRTQGKGRRLTTALMIRAIRRILEALAALAAQQPLAAQAAEATPPPAPEAGIDKSDGQSSGNNASDAASKKLLRTITEADADQGFSVVTSRKKGHTKRDRAKGTPAK